MSFFKELNSQIEANTQEIEWLLKNILSSQKKIGTVYEELTELKGLLNPEELLEMKKIEKVVSKYYLFESYTLNKDL